MAMSSRVIEQAIAARSAATVLRRLRRIDKDDLLAAMGIGLRKGVDEILAAGIRPRWVPDVETLQHVYTTTLGAGSKMRSLMVHFYLFPKTIDQVAAIVDVIKQPDCPHEFHEELAVAGMAVDGDNMPEHTPHRDVCLSRLDCEVWDLAKGRAAGDFARFHTNSLAGRCSTYYQHNARHPNTRH